MFTLPLIAISLFWPAMLLWLFAAFIPVILSWLFTRRTRSVGWGAIDLVQRAARAAWISHNGVPILLTLLRILLVVSIVLAATRPYATSDVPSFINILHFPESEQRIEVVCRSGGMDVPHLGILKALQSLAQARPQSMPFPEVVAIDASGKYTGRKQLIILSDGLIPRAEDMQRLTEKVRRGASLLVCLGNKSLLSASQSRVTAWLENMAGIRMAGSVPLAHESIEKGSGVADDQFDFMSPIGGPQVWKLVQLETVEESSHISTLLVTSQTRRPLIMESKVGRGRVVVSAIPLELSGEKSFDDGWSDLVVWPSFLPMMDGLVARWLKPVADEAGSTGTRDRVRTVVPLSRVVLVISFLFFLLELALSHSQRFFGNETLGKAVISLRVAMSVLLGVMFFAWKDVPAKDIERVSESPIAVIIDVSPSMATKVRGADATSGSMAVEHSRLMAGVNALTNQKKELSVLDKLSRYRPVSIYLASDTVRLLGVYPEEITAAELQNLSVTSPLANGSRLGDAVYEIISQKKDKKPASVIVVSDGAITGGLSWASAAQLAFEQNVPLVAVPIGEDSTSEERLPTGFRFSLLHVPRVYHLNDSMEMSCEGIASSKKTSPLTVQIGAKKSAIDVNALPTANGYDYVGTNSLFFTSKDVPEVEFSSPVNGSQVLSHGVEVTAGTDKIGRHAGSAPLIITRSPIRVLLVDHTPSFEFRYLKQLLRNDNRYELTSCLLAARETNDLRTKYELPTTVNKWNEYDVVVIGDVAVASAEEDAIAWASLQKAVSQYGVGVAWLPGRRWSKSDVGLESWLPAMPLLSVDNKPLSKTSKVFRVVASGARAGRASWLSHHRKKDSFNGLEVFSSLPKVSLGPSTRVLAVAETPSEEIPQPAIVTGRLGKGDILMHFFDTWRWQAASDDQAVRHHSQYWLRAIPYLAERHMLSRLVVATLSIRPPDPMNGEEFFIDVIPTRDNIVFRDWQLSVESVGGPIHQFSMEKYRPDSVTTFQVQGLAAGSYNVHLIPPEETGSEAEQRVQQPLTVNEWPKEQLMDAAGTGPMRAAMRAEQGCVITTSKIETMPEHIIRRTANVHSDFSGMQYWLASRFTTHCLIAGFLILCIIMWWPSRTDSEMVI